MGECNEIPSLVFTASSFQKQRNKAFTFLRRGFTAFIFVYRSNNQEAQLLCEMSTTTTLDISTFRICFIVLRQKRDGGALFPTFESDPLAFQPAAASSLSKRGKDWDEVES